MKIRKKPYERSELVAVINLYSNWHQRYIKTDTLICTKPNFSSQRKKEAIKIFDAKLNKDQIRQNYLEFSEEEIDLIVSKIDHSRQLVYQAISNKN